MPMLTPLHQGITVPDVDAAAKWYQDVFQFQIVKDEDAEALNCHIIFLRSGDFELELFQYLGPDGKLLPAERTVPNEDIKTCGTKHVAYRVEDMAGMLAYLREKQVDIAAGPFPMGGDTVCFIRDNSGILLELIEKGS